MRCFRAALPICLLALVVSAIGCAANRPATWLITGEGRAPIAGGTRETPSPDFSATAALPWSRQTLRASAVAPIAVDADTPPGAPYAAAVLAARGEARAGLRRQALELPAASQQNLADFAEVHPPAGRALDAALQSAGEDLRADWDKKEVSVALALPLTGLASAVLSSGGGIARGSTQSPDHDDGRQRAQAQLQAQREALRRARASLVEQLSVVPLNRRTRLGEAMLSNAILATAVTNSIRAARTLRSEELPASEWIVVLELDVAPILQIADSLPEEN